jgi:hypothetical protein
MAVFLTYKCCKNTKKGIKAQKKGEKRGLYKKNAYFCEQLLIT